MKPFRPRELAGSTREQLQAVPAITDAIASVLEGARRQEDWAKPRSLAAIQVPQQLQVSRCFSRGRNVSWAALPGSRVTLLKSSLASLGLWVPAKHTWVPGILRVESSSRSAGLPAFDRFCGGSFDYPWWQREELELHPLNREPHTWPDIRSLHLGDCIPSLAEVDVRQRILTLTLPQRAAVHCW